MSLEYQTEVEEAEDKPRENQTPISDVFPVYSAILIACLVIVTLVQFWVDSQDKTFGGEKSILYAGFVKPLFSEGQYWRILTGGVLHSGFPHLFFNSYATYVFGKPFEMLSNRSHLIIVFLLSVVGGGILSYIFLPDGISVGASGGVVGLLGYLTVYAFKRRKIMNPAFLKNLLLNIGLITFFGVVVMKQVDNFGHLGGFITGALYSFVQVSGDIYENPRESNKITDILGKVAIGILFIVCAFSILVMLGVIKIHISESFLQ